MPNIKFVSLAFMPNEPKSVKCKNDICICLSVHVSVCIYISVCVCVCVSFINLVSLACMPNELKVQNVSFLKNHNFKNIINRFTISFCWVAPVLMHN